VAVVGRDRELGEVGRLLDRAAAGRGDVLAVVGVPGAGKTALLDAAVALGRERGFAVFRGSPAVGQPGLFVWAQVLRDAGTPESVGARLLGDPGPLDLDRAARELVTGGRRLIVIDDLDRGGGQAAGLLPVLAARVAAMPAAVIAASGTPLGVGSELRLGPLSEDEVAALAGLTRPEIRRAVWVASRGLPGPARSLAADLAGLPEDQDALVHLALHAPSQAWFLGVDVNLVRLVETAAVRAADPARARLLARLARELLGDASAGRRRRELCDEALALARRAGDQRVLAEVLDARLHALWDPASAEDRLAAGSQIMELARAAGDQVRERHGLFWRFTALMELGRVAEAESALALFERQAEAAGDAEAAVMAKARHGMLAALRGRYDEASRLAGEVLQKARRVRLPDADNLAGTVQAMVLKDRGDRAAAADGVETMLRIARQSPGHFHDATAAMILAWAGRHTEAGVELERALPRVLAGSGPRWLGALAGLVYVAAATGDTCAAARIYDALLPYRGQLVVFGGAVMTMEPVCHYLGLLAMTLGRPGQAAACLTEAISLEEEIGALPHLAYSLDALADALDGRGAAGDADAAVNARSRSRSIAERLGMTVLLERMAPAAGEWRLTRDGDDWLLAAGGEHARLRDGRGLHYLRTLLAAPGQDIPALDLAAGGGGLVASGSGPVLDETARRAYRRRLTELGAELDRADRAGDSARARRAEAERQALLDELRRASGLAGRPRGTSQEAERARVNVTRTLRLTLARIAERAPLAAAHLQASIRTGRRCRYEPAAGGPTRWRT
jgi:tetratricopeptide (TPR) repeat protein